MSCSKNIIYGLVDPRTNLVRYVGLSSRGLSRPLRHRTQLRNDHRSNWIRQLKNEGLMYEIVILEECRDSKILGECEKWWISYGKLSCWPLTNATDGGEGGLLGYHHKPEARERIAASKRGVPRPDVAKRMSSEKRGRVQIHMMTPEALAKKAESMKGNTNCLGYKHTPETRAKIAASRRGKRSPQTLAKIAATRAANKLRKDT